MAMIERTRAARAKPIAYMRIRALPVVVVGICYLASYVLLDWISYIEPYASANITPWDPCTGLSFALVLLFGARIDSPSVYRPGSRGPSLASAGGVLGRRAFVRRPDWRWVFDRFGILVAPKYTVRFTPILDA